MAKDVDRVCEKYELKLRAGLMPARTDGDFARQLNKYRRHAEREVEVRKAVAEVLGAQGIYTIWWPYYLDFARSLTKLSSRPDSIEVQRLQARAQLELWVERGLVRAALEKIGLKVFELDLTGPVQPLDGAPNPT